MRSPGTTARLISLLAAAGAAAYFWGTALAGRSAREVLRGESEPALTAAPATVSVRPAAPRPVHREPRPGPAASATRTPLPRLEPVPKAVVAAMGSPEKAGLLQTLEGKPFRGLVLPARPVRAVPAPEPVRATPSSPTPTSVSAPAPATPLPAAAGGGLQVAIAATATPTVDEPEPPAEVA